MSGPDGGRFPPQELQQKRVEQRRALQVQGVRAVRQHRQRRVGNACATAPRSAPSRRSGRVRPRSPASAARSRPGRSRPSQPSIAHRPARAPPARWHGRPAPPAARRQAKPRGRAAKWRRCAGRCAARRLRPAVRASAPASRSGRGCCPADRLRTAPGAAPAPGARRTISCTTMPPIEWPSRWKRPDAEMVQRGQHRPGVRLDRVRRAQVVGIAVAGQIRRDDVEAVAQVLDFGLPLRRTAEVAVHQHQRLGRCRRGDTEGHRHAHFIAAGSQVAVSGIGDQHRDQQAPCCR